MKSLICLFALFISYQASAAFQPVCYQRLYTNDEIQSNWQHHPSDPQKLTEIYVKLEQKNQGPGTTPMIQASVLGTSEGVEYANTESLCYTKKDGSLSCNSDCFSAVFTASFDAKGMLVKIPAHQSVVLSNQKMLGDVVLSGDDSNNNIYRLQQVDMGECDRALAVTVPNPANSCY